MHVMHSAFIQSETHTYCGCVFGNYLQRRQQIFLIRSWQSHQAGPDFKSSRTSAQSQGEEGKYKTTTGLGWTAGSGFLKNTALETYPSDWHNVCTGRHMNFVFQSGIKSLRCPIMFGWTCSMSKRVRMRSCDGLHLWHSALWQTDQSTILAPANSFFDPLCL